MDRMVILVCFLLRFGLSFFLHLLFIRNKCLRFPSFVCNTRQKTLFFWIQFYCCAVAPVRFHIQDRRPRETHDIHNRHQDDGNFGMENPKWKSTSDGYFRFRSICDRRYNARSLPHNITFPKHFHADFIMDGRKVAYTVISNNSQLRALVRWRKNKTSFEAS